MLILVLLACTGAPPPDPAPPAPARPPDVLVVVLDTVRADALSAYGNPRPTSPQLDAIADAGLLFEDVTAPGSWTWPSHASLFTGAFPWEHGAHFGEASDGAVALEPDPFYATALREDLPTLAERFSAAGYRTASLSANRLIGPDFGLTRGFQDARTFSEDELVVQAAQALLTDSDDRPLLLFVNLFGAHAPWFLNPVPWVEARRAELHPETGQQWLRPYLLAGGVGLSIYERATPESPPLAMAYARGELEIPPEGLTLLRDLYEGEVSRVDYRLHQIVTTWNESGRGQGIVAVTSDHGEYLGERQMMAHSRTVYPEVVRVPLVIAAPGRLEANKRVSAPVQMHDLHDAVLVLAGLAEGSELLDAAAGEAPADPIRARAWKDVYWAEGIGGRFAQGYRLMRVGDEAVIVGDDGGVEYYSESSMLVERSGEAAGRVEVLRSAAEGLFEEVGGTGLIGADVETLERLEALGYTGG